MMEVPPVSQYESAPNLPKIVSKMDKLGFVACRIEKNAMQPKAGIDTEFDVVFARRKAMEQL